MKKKYKVLLIIAAVLVVVDLVGFFVFASPAMKMNKLFKALNDGDSKAAQSAYRELSDNGRTKANDLLIDFAYDKENKLENDKIKYKEFSKCMDAATSVTKKIPTEVTDFKAKGDRYQMTSLYEDCAKEYINNKQSDEYIKLRNSFLDIYDNYTDDTEFDNAMVEYLDEKNEEFRNNTITADELNAYAYTGADLFNGYSSAYDKSTMIANDLQNIQKYETHYQEAQDYFDNDQYYECYDYCQNEITYYFSSGNDTTGYSEKFEKLKNDAYEKGKAYYLEQADTAVANGNTDEAKEILQKIDEFYEGTVDTSAAWESTHEPWMTPYVEYITNINNTVKNDMASAPATGDYNDPSKMDSSYIYISEFGLYDFDENGIPELVAIDNDHHLKFIYTYDSDKVVLTGVFNTTLTYSDGPGLIINLLTLPDGWEGRSLIELSGKTWTEKESYYANFGEEIYKVNGKNVTNDEVNSESDYMDIRSYSLYLYTYDIKDPDTIKDAIYNYTADN